MAQGRAAHLPPRLFRAEPAKPSARFEWLTEWAQDLEARIIGRRHHGQVRRDAPRSVARLHPHGDGYAVVPKARRRHGRGRVSDSHAAKNEIGRRTPLGSAQIEASADSLVTVTKREDVRYMQVSGRAVHMPKTRIDYADGWVSAGMSEKAEAARDKRAELLAVIGAQPGELTRTEAVKAAGIGRNDGMVLLKAMVADGLIESRPKKRAGKASRSGRRHDRYRVPAV